MISRLPRVRGNVCSKGIQATAEGSSGDRIISRILRPLIYFSFFFDVAFDALSPDFVAFEATSWNQNTIRYYYQIL